MKRTLPNFNDAGRTNISFHAPEWGQEDNNLIDENFYQVDMIICVKQTKRFDDSLIFFTVNKTWN